MPKRRKLTDNPQRDAVINRLLQQGARNAEVLRQVKRAYGESLHSGVISRMRTKLSQQQPEADISATQGANISEHDKLMRALSCLYQAMGLAGCSRVEVMADGRAVCDTVRIQEYNILKL